jgi:hypothetical protein
LIGKLVPVECGDCLSSNLRKGIDIIVCPIIANDSGMVQTSGAF